MSTESNGLRPATWAVLIALAASMPAQAKDVMLMNRIGPSKMELYIANADGSGERRLLPDSRALDYDATFSPDGSTLFVNLQSPGLTFAITGPWRSRPA